MRRVRVWCVLIGSLASGLLPAGASSSPAPTAGVPATPAASVTPSVSERLTALEAARAKLLAECQTGLAQHDGAIAVLKELVEP